jgi:hypothetical protein
MSNRFAAGLSKLKDVSGKTASALAPIPVEPAPTEQRRPTAEPAPSRQGKVAISAYFDPAVRQQLAILAIKENRSQAALLADALNLLFEKYGEPTIARA